MFHKVFGEKVEGFSYQTREGVYAIIFDGNRLATVKTNKGHFLLGGGLDQNESHEDCLKRECLEEIGYDIEIKGGICKTEGYHLIGSTNYHMISYYYSVELKTKVQKPMEKNHVLEWVLLSQLEEKMFLNHQVWATKQALN